MIESRLWPWCSKIKFATASRICWTYDEEAAQKSAAAHVARAGGLFFLFPAAFGRVPRVRRIRLAPRVSDMLPEFAVQQTLRKALGVHFLYSLTGSLTVFIFPLTLCFFLIFGESLPLANLELVLQAFFKRSSFVIGAIRSTSSAASTPSGPSPRTRSWESMRSAAWIPSTAVVSNKIQQKWLEWICFLHAA